jgi:hypothetical protein
MTKSLELENEILAGLGFPLAVKVALEPAHIDWFGVNEKVGTSTVMGYFTVVFEPHEPPTTTDA